MEDSGDLLLTIRSSYTRTKWISWRKTRNIKLLPKSGVFQSDGFAKTAKGFGFFDYVVWNCLLSVKLIIFDDIVFDVIYLRLDFMKLFIFDEIVVDVIYLRLYLMKLFLWHISVSILMKLFIFDEIVYFFMKSFIFEELDYFRWNCLFLMKSFIFDEIVFYVIYLRLYFDEFVYFVRNLFFCMKFTILYEIYYFV